MNLHILTHILSFSGICLFVVIIYKKVNSLLQKKIDSMNTDNKNMQDKLEEMLNKIEILQKELNDINAESVKIIESTQQKADKFIKEESEKLTEYKKNKEIEIEQLVQNIRKQEISKSQKDIIDKVINSLEKQHAENDIIRKS